MPPIKAIIHEATFLLRAATDGKPTVVVIVGTGVTKQREKKKHQNFRPRTVMSVVLRNCGLPEHKASSYLALVKHNRLSFGPNDFYLFFSPD